MDEKKPVETCARCKKTYENDGFVFVCPHCGQPRWGDIFTFLVVAVLCIWVFFQVSPNMNPGFWRGVVRWVTGIFGVSSSIAVVVAFFHCCLAPKSSKPPALPHLSAHLISLPPSARNRHSRRSRSTSLLSLMPCVTKIMTA